MKGYTLIELMVATALLAIVVEVGGHAIAAQRARSSDLVLRERARQVLESEADARLSRIAPDEGVRAKLLAELPQGTYEAKSQSASTLLSVTWRGADGRTQSLELPIVEGGR